MKSNNKYAGFYTHLLFRCLGYRLLLSSLSGWLFIEKLLFCPKVLLFVLFLHKNTCCRYTSMTSHNIISADKSKNIYHDTALSVVINCEYFINIQCIYHLSMLILAWYARR